MAIVNIDNLQMMGVLQDVPAHKLPPEALTSVKNVRFFDGAVHKIEGHVDMFGTLAIQPWCLFPWKVGSAFKFIYANSTAIYMHDGATETDITRTVGGAYAAGANPKWLGGVFQGIPVLNNTAFADVPQSWNGTTDMQDLPNWPASTYAKILRPFNEFLVAAHMQESAVELPYKLRWSNAAQPGSIPSTWVPAANNFAGDTPKLAATTDLIVDMMPLGSLNIIYKEDHVWKMQYVGRPSVFGFRQAFEDFGMLARNCALEFRKQHFVVAKGDFIVHNGETWNSVGTQRMRRSVFATMDNSNYVNTFVARNTPFNEIWVFFPEQGETYCNLAAIWNYENNTWTIREVPSVCAAQQGLDVSAASSTTFDASTGTFDTDIGIFDEFPYNPAQNQFILGDTETNKLYRADSTNQFNGSNFESSLERLSLPIAGKDRFGAPQINMNSVKMFNRIRPKMTGSGTVYWRFGTQDQPNGPVTWDDPQPYVIGSGDFIDFDRSGKMFCYKCYDAANQDWAVTGLELDMRVISQYG